MGSARVNVAKGWMVAGLALVGLLGGCANNEKGGPKKEYMFWPPAPETPRVQFLMSISYAADVTGEQGKMDALIYGKDTQSDLPLQRPYGVRIYEGRIYACDATAANVTILDMRKKEVRILGRGSQFNLVKPIDIAVAPDGLKYVADTGLGAVAVFDAEDHFAGKITLPGLRPVSVAVRGNELYISDMRASAVRVVDRISGKELRKIGEPGSGPGKLGGSMGLALDREGNVYVNDVVGCRVQKFTPEGKFVSILGGLGDRPGNFVRPKQMAVDESGILYVVDNAFQNVQMFNEKGQMLMFFGAGGTHPGAMNLPTGVAVSDTNLDLFSKYVHPAFDLKRVIVVTNNFGPVKINIYGLGELKPGKTVADISGRMAPVIGFADKPSEMSGAATQGAVPTDLQGSGATQPSATQSGATTQGGASTQSGATTKP